ncbi:unnamed protein product (macronuclear) [Paramecium tetraurelia]|uniref:Uncharacterized protein n=1 Tax=Paramecium tetraurelia TaxID=5888 RepID=A0EAB4_PARTE|nr:uncharacterized protein GSPATT00024963001 [Paramecium tetraurelia]CAK92231.1 unnamed protein product [Paramecium tetraurelia]|eukprot:XP_001459628.1 hypothetical protein (macronuclear) [Paramecium tetraurelia strain d4-2]
MKSQQGYLSEVDINQNHKKYSSRYKMVNEKRNSMLVSLVQPNRKNLNKSFVPELQEMPMKQRRNSYQEGISGQKMSRLNCLYPQTICMQHALQKPKIDNKATLRKAVKRASIMMTTVKYWKDHSYKKIEVPAMIKSIHTKDNCLCDRNALTTRSVKKSELPPVLLSQYRIKNNERLIQYSRDRTADKTKSVSHHFSNLYTHSIPAFSPRYSIQNANIRIKQ